MAAVSRFGDEIPDLAGNGFHGRSQIVLRKTRVGHWRIAA
jgi:hypothetical protein